jgi:hypothetical protein
MFLLAGFGAFSLFYPPKAVAQTDTVTAEFTYTASDLGCSDGTVSTVMPNCENLARMQAKLDAMQAGTCVFGPQVETITYSGVEDPNNPDGLVIASQVTITALVKYKVSPYCTA